MNVNLYYILLLVTYLLTSCTENKIKEKQVANFQEKYRPQVHFTPEKNWMNDPNGMVFYKGEYHLFYQHYPEKPVWGPMHWGHAISKDLVHWEHLPIAIYPDSLGYIFSGGAIVDFNNTSGLGTIENPPLIAFFTYHDMEAEKQERYHEVESQAIAYSIDSGRTWIKYKNNPILENPGIRDFRDPKVIWDEQNEQWVMSIASGQVIKFYSSLNCLDWSYLSEFGEGKGNHSGVWECPDLFPLKVKNSEETKWVLVVNINPGGPAGGSATQYFVGNFDGKYFTTDQDNTLWMDHGKDNYAGVTWSNAPDDRRILIGWMNNWQYAGEKPTIEWSGALTFPRELGLVKEKDYFLLTSEPIKEISVIYGKKDSVKEVIIEGNTPIFEKTSFLKAPIEISVTFNVEDNTKIDFPEKYGIIFKNYEGEYYKLGYDNVNKLYYADRTHSTSEDISENFPSLQVIPFTIEDKTVTWRIIVDTSSIEAFASSNKIAITNVVYPSSTFNMIEVFAENGKIELISATITELNSIWK